MKNKSKVLISILLICIFTTSIFVYGEENSKALHLVETLPKHFSIDVPLDTEIKLLFNKNVVNFSVKENNSTCFSIVDENNEEILIDVIFPDDQIEPDRKREIFIKPKEAFKENTTYTVNISSNLMAKNGNSLGENIAITFTTIKLTNVETDSNKSEEPKEISAYVEKPDGNSGDVVLNLEEAETDIVTEKDQEEVIPAPQDASEEDLDEENELIGNAIEKHTNPKNSGDEAASEAFSDALAEDDTIEATKFASTNYLLPVFIVIIVLVAIIIIKGKKK